MKRIAVYCSASDSVPHVYCETAYRLGEIIAAEGIELVYGDGGIGLMKHVSDGVLDAGGKAIGVIPRFMVEQGWNNPRSTQTIVTESMHERQAVITDMTDAMVALPGGVGTMAELFECLTWKQLGLHACPIVILNVNGYYDPIIKALDKMVSELFMQAIHRDDMFSVVTSVEQVLPAIRNAVQWGAHMRNKARTY